MSDIREFQPMPQPAPLSLSAAIRLGALLGTQTFGVARNNQGGACALFGALEAAGLHWQDHLAIEQTFPLLIQRDLRLCPSCGESFAGFFSIGYLIIHLNDAHRWTRDQIADHVVAVEHDTETVTV